MAALILIQDRISVYSAHLSSTYKVPRACFTLARNISILDDYDSDDQTFNVLKDMKLLERDKQEETLFGFLPFRNQIMDKDSYQQNKLGSASHDKYKQSQVRYARRRVMGKVLLYKGRAYKKPQR